MKLNVLVPCGLRLGEAPVWSAEKNLLLWIDLPTAQFWRHDFSTGKTRSDVLAVEPLLGAIAPTRDPHVLILTHRSGISLLNMEALAITPFADPEHGRDGVMYNDAKIDRRGRLWAGTSHVAELEPRGALWIIDQQRKAALVDTGFAIANGPAFSPDGKTAYFSDSLAKQILAYDIAADGAVSNRRVFCTFKDEEGLPDGVTVDEEGYLWVAHWAGARVTRRNLKGEVVARIDVPSPHVTSLCFGAADYSQLFITTAWDAVDEGTRKSYPLAGHVFQIAPGVKGLAEPLFSKT
jgi:xylono-1,5-lactonase